MASKKPRKDLCHHCGASMMVNSYSMNRTLLRALIKLVREPSKPVKEIGLTRSEYANYTKLKFWGFIVQLEDGNWKPTADAKAFLGGHLVVPKEIEYFRNKVVNTHGATTVYEVIPTEESKQKYREMMKPYLE